MKTFTLFAIASLLLCGCASTNSGFRRPDLSKISVGMTKQEVIAELGKPDAVSAAGGTEFLRYGWDDPLDGRIAAAEYYFVRLTDGRVVSYGKDGDFDPTIRVKAITNDGK